MPGRAVKSSIRYLIGLFAFGFCFGLAAQESQPPPVTNDFSSGQIMETWGWIIAHRENVVGIDLSETELSGWLKGFDEGLKNQPLPYDARKISPDVEKLAKARREKIVRAVIQKNEAEAGRFFDALKKNTNAVGLPGNVWCEILKPGDGASLKPRQTVNVHYTARLIDGTEFSQMGPIDRVLVTNRDVCRGWFGALQKIKKGGALKLFVPPPLSEDDAFKWGIQPGSAMIFEIELLDIKNTSPGDLEDALLPPAPEPPEPPPSGYSDAQIIETWGWDVARNMRADKFEPSADEIRLLAKGLAAGIRNDPPPSGLEKIYPAVEKFVGARREKIRGAERQKQMDEMNRFFAALKQNTNVAELPDGLRYEILKPGRGAGPKPGQIVLVDYTGSLINGTVFDQTYNEPLHIEVGSVIEGWNEGIQKINQGGKIKLYVPPSLGYGDEDMSGVIAPIPADSVLIYEIELLDIQASPPGDAPGKK